MAALADYYPALRAAPGPLQLGLVFLLYLAGAKLGVLLTAMPEGIAIVWPPNAVVLAALLRFGLARYWAVALLALGAEVTADWGHFTLTESLLFGVINVGEATLIFLLLRRWNFDAHLASPADLGKFLLAGPALGAFAAALAGGAVYSAFRGTETPYLEFVRIWWFGDGLGLLVFTPLLLGFRPFGAPSAAPAPPFWAADVVVWAGGVVMLAMLWQWSPGYMTKAHVGPVLLLPFVLYIAARGTPRWTAAAVAAVALFLVLAVTQGHSPFAASSPGNTVIHAQEFILVMSVMALGLASLLAQVRSQQREAAAANRALRRLNEELESRVESRTAELRHANRVLAEQAAVDPLTELYNQRGLQDIGQREIALARRGRRSLALLMIDVDHFKAVNDRYGHLAGDKVLRHCADLLRVIARASDSCGRYGGEEFVLIAPDTELTGAQVLGERICARFREHAVRTADAEIGVTASIGITLLGPHDSTLRDLLRRADAALYEAKNAGRDRVVVIAPGREPAGQPPGA